MTKRNTDYIYAALTALVFFIIYILFLNDHRTHAHDAADYFRRIVSDPVLHGNHLLYEPAGRLWFDIMRPLIPESWLSDFRLLAMMNSVFGALTMGLFYLFGVRHFKLDPIRSILTVISIGFSFYYLTYSTTVEIYVPAFFFAFLAYYIVLTQKITASQALTVGLIHGFAMIFHQMTVLFGVIIVARYLKHKAEGIVYLLAGAMIVIGAYGYVAYLLEIETVDQFIKFFSGYMGNDHLVEVNNNRNSPIYAIYGFAVALLGGRYFLSLEPIKTILETRFTDHFTDRLIYLHHQTSIFSGAIQIAAHVVFIVCLVMILRHWWQHKRFDRQTIDLWVLFALNTAFFTFWYPHNPEFWGIQMICLIFIFMRSMPSVKIMGVTALSIMVINILGTGLPLKDPDNDLHGEIKSLFEKNL